MASLSDMIEGLGSISHLFYVNEVLALFAQKNWTASASSSYGGWRREWVSFTAKLRFFVGLRPFGRSVQSQWR